MTGEMSKAEVTRDNWPLHFAIADAISGSTVKPFDMYQGPYIALQNGGRLFIGSKDGVLAYVWNDRTGTQSGEFLPDGIDAAADAVAAAREILGE